MKVDGDPILVTTAEGLEKAKKELMNAPVVGVDTESNSLHAYREQVCLIQFSTKDTDYLVDPLAVEVRPLGEVFVDERIEKVFHAAEYDLLCLKRDFGFEFRNLFDTMVAARILGRKKVGLGDMLAESFGVKLQKRFQRADWGRRPLRKDMLAYARLDTHFLIPLRDRLMSQLREARRWPIAKEDFLRLTRVNGMLPGPAPGDVWNVKGAFDLEPEEIAILKELVDYRDQKAQDYDLPPFKVMGDKTLLAIAERAPRELEDLQELPGMSTKQVKRHGKAILAAVSRGSGAAPPKRPRRSKYNEAFVERLEALRNWRKNQARRLDVESDVVLPRDLMEEIARRNPTARDGLEEILSETPWRLGQYGEQILRVVAKH